MEETLSDRRHIDKDLLEVGTTANKVQTELQVYVLRPGVLPFGKHIIHIATDIKTKDRGMRQQVVGHIRGTAGDTCAIMYKLSLCRYLHQHGHCHEE